MARTLVASESRYMQSSSLPVSAVTFSFAGWINPTSLATDQSFFDLGSTTGSQYFQIRINTVGDLILEQWDGATSGQARLNGSMTTITWQHIGGTFTSNNLRSLFRNGGSKTTNATTVNTPAALDRMTFGARVRSGTIDHYGNCQMFDLAIWNTTLADADFASLAGGAAPSTIPTGLVWYAPCLGTASPEPDLIAGRDLTLFNFPAVGGAAGNMFLVL